MPGPNLLDQIALPDSTTYDLKDYHKSGVYTVIGTQTEATASWTGELHGVSALFDGLTINYYLPYAGIASTSVTLNLTLDSGSTTGAKNCYINTSRLTTHYGAGRTIVMTYYSAGSISIAGTVTEDDRWICDAYYDGDTKVRQSLLTNSTNRPLLMSYAQNNNTTNNVDNVVYRNNSIYATPSTGTITALKFSGDLVGNADTATNASAVNGHTVGIDVPSNAVFTDTTYESKTASSGGTDVSLCTTGEKYTWNNKSDLTIGTTSTTALAGDTLYAGASTAGGSATSAVKLDTSTAGSATQPCYFSGGTPSACTYSLNKTVPSDAIFTDQNVTQTYDIQAEGKFALLMEYTANGGTLTEGVRKSGATYDNATGQLQTTSVKANEATIPSFAGNAITCKTINGVTVGNSPEFTDTKNTAGSTDTSSKIYLIGATEQSANPQTYSDNQCYVTSGTLQTNILNATAGVNVNTGNSGTAGGLCLYNTTATSYGLLMRKTGSASGELGKHGYVQGDWAIYNTMNSASSSGTRGWIYRTGSDNIASISITGNAVFNGSVTIGGNTTNTSGARMEYNSTTQAIDFVFN